jgi:hypothetical protein
MSQESRYRIEASTLTGEEYSAWPVRDPAPQRYAGYKADEGVRPYASRLDVQVLHIQRVVFNELAPGFDVLSHQRGEDGLAFGDILQLH